MSTNIWFFHSECVSDSSYFFFSSSLLTYLIYVCNIHASVLSFPWIILISYTLLLSIILCLYVSKVVTLNFLNAYMLKYLYNTSPKMSSSSMVYPVSIYLPRHFKKSSYHSCYFDVYDSTYFPLTYLGYNPMFRNVIKLRDIPF